MASASFYFLASAGYPQTSGWGTPASAWDNNLSTFSLYTVPAGTKANTDWLKASEFSSSTLSEEIHRVEVGLFCDVESATFNKIYVVPVFSGGVSGSEYDVSATETSGWQQVDITNDSAAPTTWKWDDVHDLEVNAYGGNTDASGRWVRIHEYRLIVTQPSQLESLVASLPDTIQLLNLSLTKIDEQIKAIQDDKAGVIESQNRMVSGSNTYVETKRQEFENFYGSPPGQWKTRVSGGYAETNLTEWRITSGSRFFSKKEGKPWIYLQGSDVTSGSPGTADTDQYNRQIDFPTTLDHLNKSSSLTGTYGINARISSLETAKGLTQKNLDKVRRFEKTYRRN